MTNKITAWVTRYALGRGIKMVSGKINEHDHLVVRKTHDFYADYYPPSDFHTTRDAAIARAEAMRLTKIAGLKKTIAKLEKLTWDDVPMEMPK